MNPEFRRQLWLHFSLNRVVLMPLLLLTGALGVVLSAPDDSLDRLAAAACTAFFLLVCVMGTRAAGASVLDEMNELTWDQQRMSAMQPWPMTWGKLAGSTAYTWYGGAVCLAVGVPSALLSGQWANINIWALALSGILLGVSLQSLLLAVNLQLAKLGGRMVKQGGFLGLLLIAIWLCADLMTATNKKFEVQWWHQTYSAVEFSLLSLVLFTTCTLLAAWRSMADMLAVRQWPWGWPLLAVVATVFFAGLESTGSVPSRTSFGAVFGVASTYLGSTPSVSGLASSGVMISAALTYFALLSEPQPRPMWQRVVSAVAARRWRAALQLLPRWPTSLVMVFFFAVVLSLYSHGVSGESGNSWQTALHSQALSVALLVLRDCALALFFGFSAQGRRPALAFGVLMLVLYGLLPWMMSSVSHGFLLGLVFPPVVVDGYWAVWVATLHAAVACSLLAWRWRQTRP